MTPDDLRILVETEDEFARRGNFTRIFPTANSKNYMKFFEMPRYYNILVTEWIDKFKRNREKGIIWIKIKAFNKLINCFINKKRNKFIKLLL